MPVMDLYIKKFRQSGMFRLRPVFEQFPVALLLLAGKLKFQILSILCILKRWLAVLRTISHLDPFQLILLGMTEILSSLNTFDSHAKLHDVERF